MRLRDKVAIIAGAAWGGIGAATALRFAQEGAKVVINTRGRAEKLEQTATYVREAGSDAVTVMGDVAEAATWQAMVRAALESYGRLDILVHNAAHTYLKRAAEFTQEEWNYGLAVTLGGPWLGAKHCIPEMIKQGGGAIVFISTVNAAITNPLFGLYGAAKGGLNALTRSIALDYGRDGIRCNAIAPGQIVGEREQERLARDPLEDRLSRDCYPLGRYGRPEEIANAALFLASDEASFITGIVLTADGGLTLQSPEALVRPSFRKRWRDDLLIPHPLDEVGLDDS
ncbi:MAG TPA: SDR family oxidoreductase [Caldilineaceae bacterium]|nr:SDR family oxidoreductase [Caldilineaceae bacterium]